MGKRKQLIYDPKYAKLYGNIGQSMRKSSAEDLRAQARADANINYNPEFTSGYAQTGGPDYYQPITPSYGDENDSNSSLWDTVGDIGSAVVKPIKDIYNFDWTSTWNLLVKRQKQANLGNEEERLQNLIQEKNDLEDFSSFVDEYNSYKEDLQKLQILKSNGDVYGAQNLQREIQDKYPNMLEKINYYTQAVKTNPTLQNLMYNTAVPNNLKDTYKIGAKVVWDALDHVNMPEDSNGESNDNGVTGFFKNKVGKPVLQFLSKAAQGGANLLDFITNPSSEMHTRRAIARGALDDDDLQKLQKYDINHLTDSSLSVFKNDIKKRIKEIQPDIDEQQATVADALQTYSKGNLFYNPKKIDPNFERIQQTTRPGEVFSEKGITALLYGLPELGSSFSSWKAFTTSLGLQFLGNYAANAVKTKSPTGAAAITLATQLGSLATSYSMRQDETNSEASDAYLQKVQEEAINKHIDLARILNITKQYCNSVGIDTDGLNEQDLLQLSIQYNIQTGDPLFEKIKRDSRIGINKLKAQNNALGYMDYIETLPFAGNFGSIVKRNVDKVARNMAYKKSLRYTSEDMYDAVERIADKSLTSEAKRSLSQGWISKKIDNILRNHGGSIEKQIARRNMLHSLGNLGKKTLFVAATEGAEEGQQAYMQHNYQTGKYDQDDADYNFGRGFDINSLIDDNNLAFSAATSYFGLNFGDPLNGDESLRQQMEIGALTSFWFGLGHQALGSVFNSQDSFRNIVSQYKFDKNLMRYVANNYKLQQDDEHAGIFFDTFKNGGNADKIARSYDAFKYLKNNELITDQDLDDDVKLAHVSYGVYQTTKNKKNKVLDDLNIDRDSEDHKEYIKQASRVILDYQNVLSLANKSNSELFESLQDLVRQVKEYKKQSSSENQQDSQNNPLMKSLIELVARTIESDRRDGQTKLDEIGNSIAAILTERDKRKAAFEQTKDQASEESTESERKTESDEKKTPTQEYEEWLEESKKKEDSLRDEYKKQSEKLDNIDEDEYIDKVVTSLFQIKRLNILKGLYSKLQNQKDKLESIKKAFGYNVNIESLYGMKNAIKDHIDELNKRYGDFIKENKKLIDKYIDIIPEEFNNQIVVDSLNSSIVQSLATKYAAYYYNSVDPRTVQYAVSRVKWENLTDMQRTNFQNNLIREKQQAGEDVQNIDFKKEWILRNSRTNLKMNILKSRRKKIEDNKGTDNGMLPIDEQEAIEEINKNAAMLIIQQDMSDRFYRKQMVRLERYQNEPLTIEDLDNANNGDKKAQQKIIDTAERQQEEDKRTASEQARGQLDQDKLDAQQSQIDRARYTVYGEKSDELTDKAKRRAEKSTLTGSQIDQMIAENVEGGVLPSEGTEGLISEENPVGTVSEGSTIEEAEAQRKVDEENLRKRQLLQKAVELLRKKPENDTTDPSIYLQQKLKISEELADEFVEIYNAIVQKENKQAESPAPIEGNESQEYPIVAESESPTQIEDGDHVSQAQVTNNDENLQVGVNDQPGQIVSTEESEQIGGMATVNIAKDGTVTIVPPVQQKQDDRQLENTDTNSNTGAEKDKSLQDQPTIDESEGDNEQNDEDSQEELHDESQSQNAFALLTGELIDSGDIDMQDENVAQNTAKSFLEKHVQGLPFEDCISNVVKPSELVTNVLHDFYNKYPVPKNDSLVISPTPNDVNLNEVDTDENGQLTISGNPIDEDMLMFSGLDDSYDEQVYDGKIEAEHSVVTSEIGNPFYYRPDSTIPMVFKHNKKPILTNKHMATGSELNAKLSIPGWFSRVTKTYYIVSGDDNSRADDLTVAMIIEDPDDSSIIYNVSMREPSMKHFDKNNLSGETRLTHIIKRLKFLNVNTQLYNALLNNAMQSILTAYNLKHKTQLTESEFKTKFNQQYEEIEERCRLQSSISKDYKVFTNNEINVYLQRLREQRQQIIDACCTKNEDGTYNPQDDVNENVRPQTVILTNGKLNNLKNGVGIPILRPVFGENGGFGFGSTISEISDQIESGQVQFGVGTGPFGQVPGPNAIRPINGANEEIPGTGKAGKLYIKIPSKSQPASSAKQVYIQLTEQKLTTQTIPDDDSVTESFTLDGVADLNNPPSLAEIAFRLITGHIDKKSVIIGRNGLNTVGLSDETIEMLSNLLINHGKQTLIGIVKPDMFGNIKPSQKNAYLSHILGFYADKQIACIKHADGSKVLYIGDRDENGNSFLHEYKMQDLFPSNNSDEQLVNQCDANRRHVIALIEKNMHWNTNVDLLMNTLDDQSLYSTLDQYFFDNNRQRKVSNGKPIDVFNPFGNEDFSFKYDDFYNEDGSRKNPSVLAWMIKNGKILTDVGTNGNDMFNSPFVFANGVKAEAKPESKKKSSKKTSVETEPKTEPKNKTQKIVEKVNKSTTTKKNVPNVTFEIPNDEAYKSVSVDKEKTDTYLVTATTISSTGKQLSWNKSNPEKLRQAMLEKFKELEKAGIKIDESSMRVFNAYKKFKGFNIFLHIKEDGSASLTIDFQTKKSTVGGIYSKKRGKGRLDADSAKTWIQTALGLSDDQILVTNGIMKSLSNDTVYGVTNLAASSIVDSVYGFITLSKIGGKGIEYHEAWHYVNLLLHNRAMRTKIYNDYRSRHPELKNVTIGDIEEALAEDFRSYMLGFEDQSWSARTKRFFKNIKQVVKAFFGKPDVIYQAYRNIKKGKYVGAKLDSESIEEFKKRYPEGVYFEIPGLTNEQVTKFTYIQDYHQYYQCAKLLCNKVMEGFDLSSVDKIKNYSKEDFDIIFEDIKQQIENDPNSESSKLLQDIVDNKDAFYRTIATMLKTFSIDIKHKKTKLDDDITNGKDSGDVADNIWDIDHMEVSKKINVGYKAKLFFSTIPMYDVVTDENGDLQYIPNTDPLFGSQNYWSFSKGWNKIMSELWNCDNFDKIDQNTGEYSSTSLVGMVQRLSKSGDKFFHAMYEKLEPLIDEDDESMSVEAKLEIKTQILNTIQSSKNRITVLSINEPRQFSKKNDQQNMITDSGTYNEAEHQQSSTSNVLLDIQKSWKILDSEHLQSKYILARTWSENLLSGSGAVETDPKTGDMFISSSYLKKLKTLITNAEKAVKKQGTQTQNFANNNSYKSINDAKNAICQVLNYMAIPADGQVLQQLINTELSLNPNAYPETTLEEKERHVLRDMLMGTGTATIKKLYGQLSTANRGKTITIGNKGEKDISEFYKGYSTAKSSINGKKTTKGLPWIGKLTVAYAKTYPSSAEMSVTGANGAQIYPINQNNAVSDFLHRLQYDTDGELENKKSTAYTQNSLIVQNAENDRVYSTPEDEKMHLNTFVCLKDQKTSQSADYFGITPMEDYMSKFIMTYNKHLIFPTMADKKTWYSITSKWLSDKLSTDVILLNSENPQLSSETIDIFSAYFIDELNSLKQYYDKDNIKALLNNPNKLLVNFHGKIVVDEYDLPNGKKYKHKHLNFDGNGGKFRYFYDILKRDGLNLNQRLELEYKTEQLENAKRASVGDVEHITDGFERVRKALSDILDDNVESEKYKTSATALRNSINALLLSKVRQELDTLATDENLQLIVKTNNGYLNNGLPKDILKYYQNQITDQYGTVDDVTLEGSAVYSAIANHVLRTMMSIIEVEKIFTGDPAMYKWITYKDKQLSKTTKDSLTKEVKLYDGSVEKVSVSMLKSKDVDKIKRLGGVLSPGVNLKTQFTEREKEILKDFGTSKYTFMNVSDVKAQSIYLDSISNIFMQNEIVQALKRSFTDKYIIENFSSVVGLDPKNVKRVQKIYYSIYRHPEYIDKVLSALKNTAENEAIVDDIQNRVNDSLGPYRDITVSDAQVCLRPSMYRKLRIAVGEWSFEEDSTGYSDEKAYNLIENDDNWMNDPEKYAIGSRLMLKPLKMSYFQNSTTANIGKYKVSLPIYNKMAMFPMFKFICQSEIGKALYDRMNMVGNEIDMLGFESAVKVGCNQNMYTPYKKGVTDLSTMDLESLALPSNASVDYQTGEVRQDTGRKKTLAVQIQDMNNLHLQLNTDAHEATERSIGTQMMKICFSNIDPNMRYGKDGQKGEGRLGSAIRNDIMNLVNAMTQIGTDNVRKRFFKKDKNGRYTIPDHKRIQEYILSICENNDLGLSSEEIIRSGGKVASLTARQIFEQSISSLVNKEVVDINTNGGAAVQQSCFGFIGYSKNNTVSEKTINNTQLYNTNIEELDISIRLSKVLQAGKIKTINDILNNEDYVQSHLGVKLQSELQDLLDNLGLNWNDGLTDEQLKNIQLAKRHVLNDGKPLRWYNGKGTMEVMLSLNFFRNVIPEKYNTDYTTARQWLIDNDIINGTKSDGTQSDPKPYGVGYRIPTQGMSSTFGFIVADVLPETSGDLIIVPTEFTAQTGSDFDVDKLYLATYSYKINGDTSTRYKTSSKSDMKYVDYLKEDIGALRNKLLDDYIDIISDYKNTADARASIDVLTSKLKDEIIPYLSDQTTKYAESMYELLPSFQARRKMEYSTGKSGIGPFALNVTNLAMTQAVGLKMKFGKNDKLLNECFDFGNITDVVGKDGYTISAWLSAMVNAHVDVAKDPYILNLNVNSATYKYTNFLLRTGQGMSTFTLLAQPALKRMANMIINGKGMYGQSLGVNSRAISEKQPLHWNNEVRGYLMRQYIHSFMNISQNLLSSGTLTQGQTDKLQQWLKCVSQDPSTYNPNVINQYIINDKAENKKILYTDNELRLLDIDTAKQFLKAPRDHNTYEYAKWCMFQALSLQFIGDITEASNLLSDLVSNSRIDTKKFGNNIISQYNFLNGYNNFKNSEKANKYFYIDDGREHKELPMYTYFEHTFLDKKLRNATQLTRSLLRNQSFTASPLFGRVFSSVMASIFGDNVYRIPKGFDEKGKPVYEFRFGYNKVMNDDQVQIIGKSLESIFRHRAFLAYAQQVGQSVESNDLSFNNNEEAAKRKVIELLYGTDKKPSLPRRLSIMKAYIKQLVFDKISKQETIPDWLGQLCDDNGVIKNEFLNYLNPILDKAGTFIDRIVLASSSMDVDSQYKSQLQSAFGELLSLQTSSTNEQDVNCVKAIQALANDLITYSYYTTFNNGGVNQFFDLVPPTYRRLYDNSIKTALMNGGNNDELMAQSVLGDNIMPDKFGALNVLRILDSLCKNFWKDPQIVPTYKRLQKSTSLYAQTGEVKIKTIPSTERLDGLINIPIAIALPVTSTSEFKGATAPYITMEYGKTNKRTFLFKKIGTQYLVKVDPKTEKETRSVFKNVYMITNKLSLQDGKNKQFEFFQDDNTSIFNENNLNPYVEISNEKKPGTPISLTEDEVEKALNVERKGANDVNFKRLGKNAQRLEYEPYRPIMLDATGVVSSDEELQNDSLESSTMPDNKENPTNDQPAEQPTEPNIKDNSSETIQGESTNSEQLTDNENSQQLTDDSPQNEQIGGELDISDLSTFGDIDLSSLPQVETTEMSEQDKKEAEEHKNNCKK